MAVDIRFLGHACFELKAGGATVLIDPFLTGNPKAAVDRRRGRRRTRSCSPTATPTTSATRSTSPSAPARTVVAIIELADEIGERRASRTCVDPNLGGTVAVRLGLGQARARLAHRARRRSGTVAHAGRPADPHRRPARLPPRRHGAVQRHEADRAARRQGRPRARADRRPLHDGPLRRRDRGRVHRRRSRSSRATTTRSRRSRPTREAFKSDVENARLLRGRRPRPGRDPHASSDPRDRAHRGRALGDRDARRRARRRRGRGRGVLRDRRVGLRRDPARARARRRSPTWSRTASPSSRASGARTRWSRSRSSRSTTSRRCSRSAT